MSSRYTWRTGGCHCGVVRFEAALPDTITVEECNCSICAMTGNRQIIVPANRFRWLGGEQELSEYRFNTKVARHLFCRHCGVKSVYIPRSNPDGYAVTWRCLDEPDDFSQITIDAFDGVNWEDHAGRLANKSKE